MNTTTPATPILEWEAEALNHLADLKFKAEEASAVEQFAYQTLQEVRNDKDSDEYELDMACRDYYQAVKARNNAQTAVTSYYKNYRA